MIVGGRLILGLLLGSASAAPDDVVDKPADRRELYTGDGDNGNDKYDPFGGHYDYKDYDHKKDGDWNSDHSKFKFVRKAGGGGDGRIQEWRSGSGKKPSDRRGPGGNKGPGKGKGGPGGSSGRKPVHMYVWDGAGKGHVETEWSGASDSSSWSGDAHHDDRAKVRRNERGGHLITDTIVRRAYTSRLLLFPSSHPRATRPARRVERGLPQ